jgi:phage terminase large subunit-like protein
VEGPIVRGEGWLRLILVWPPGTGKTWAGKLLMAWCFGLHPDWHALTLCLSANLASDIGSDVRNLIASREFADVFPGVALSKDSASKKHFEVVDRSAYGRGEFNAAGRSTRFTGRRAKLLNPDDLLNEKEADSPAALADAKNTIDAARSRCHPAGFHVVVNNTRYREDDPIGYLLDKYKSDGPWDVVVLPVIVEKGDEQTLSNGWHRPLGDILFPYNAETVKALRDGLMERKPHEWYGQYKGRPRPPTGRKVDVNDVQLFDEPLLTVRNRCERTVMIIDTARKAEEQNDPSALLVFGQWGNRHNLLHSEAERLPFLDLCVRVALRCLEWKPALVLIEDSANGTALGETLKRQGYAIDTNYLPHRRIPFSTPVEYVLVAGNSGSKVMRFDAAVSPATRQGWLWMPRNAPWREDLAEKLASFPRCADDEMDCLAMWFKWAAEHGVEQMAPINVPAAVAQAAAMPGRRPQRNDWQAIGGRNR